MRADLDSDLMQAFAEPQAPLPAATFERQLMHRIAWRRRARAVLRLAYFASLVLLGAFASHMLIDASLFATEQLGELLISPSGWTLSLLLAVVAARRRRLIWR